MKLSIRVAVAACAGLAALAFVGSAMAAYSPRLVVTTVTNKPSKQTTLLLSHVQDINDDPTARDTIYAPLGYQANLSQPVGTTIGDVVASGVFRQGANTPFQANGTVTVDNLATWATQAAQCTGTTTHDTVWRADVTLAGSALHVPIWVDHVTTPPENTFASVRIQFCLVGPLGTPLGAQVLIAVFDVEKVFTNPPGTADRVWHALFLPYAPGTPNPNPAAMTEGQAVSPGRVSLSLTVKRLRHRVVLLQGRLLVDGQPQSGVTVELYGTSSSKRLAKAKTNRSGRYTFRRKLKRKARFYVLVIAIGDLPSCPAPPLGIAPQGCTTATISFAAATGIVTARPRR